MDYSKFKNKTEGQTLEEIVHKSKKKSQKLLEDQGISAYDEHFTSIVNVIDYKKPEEIIQDFETY